MKTSTLVPSLAMLCLGALTSCNKETPVEPIITGLQGSWKLSSVTANTEETTEITEAAYSLKTISAANYTSTSNVGTVQISEDSITSLGLAYDVSTTVKTDVYENGEHVDTQEEPFYISLPVSNGVSKYEMKGSDSLYFPNGSFVTMDGNLLEGKPGSCRYEINGTQLTVFQTYDMTSRTTAEGFVLTHRNKASLVCILERQSE